MVVCAAMVFMICLSTAAKLSAAEENDVVRIDTSKVHDLDELTVVVRSKEFFRLRQQPVSSSTFSQSDMRRLSSGDMSEIGLFVPSFSMPNYGTRLTSSMYIRGIGTRINNPAVAMYVDDVPILGKSAFNVYLNDVAMFEVLRGPQATLYGQNSEGGLVRIYTVNPLDVQETTLKLSAGTHGFRNLEFKHSDKIGKSFAYSLSAFYDGKNGFQQNVTLGKRSDKSDEAGARLKLLYENGTGLSLNLISDYQYVRQNGFSYGELDLTTGKTGQPSSNRLGYYRRNMLNTSFGVAYKKQLFDLSSVTSWQHLADYMLMDIDYLPADFMHLKQRQTSNGLTQEVVLKTKGDGWWQSTTGAFFSHSWLKTSAPVYFDDDFKATLAYSIENGMKESMVQSMVNRGMTQAQAAAMVERMGVSVNGVEMSPVTGLFHTPVFNLAFFHQTEIDITKNFRATFGLRYDYNHVKIDYDSSVSMSLDATVSKVNAVNKLSSALSGKTSDAFNQLLPRMTLSYTFNNNVGNVYFTVSKGYRAGGYNIQMFSDILQSELLANSANVQNGDYDIPHGETEYEAIEKTISYKPETTWNHEVGTHINMFGGRVHFDASVYYMQVHNQQLSLMAGNYGFGRRMVNAGRSRSLGIETALCGKAFNNRFSWSASYAYTHATFRNYADSVGSGASKTYVDYRGKHVPYIPLNTAAFMASYMMTFKSCILKSLTLSANLSLQGKAFWDEANTYSQPLYALLGSNVELDFGNVVVAFKATNLTNTRYNTFAFDSSATGLSKHFAQRGAPALGFVEMRLRL